MLDGCGFGLISLRFCDLWVLAGFVRIWAFQLVAGLRLFGFGWAAGLYYGWWILPGFGGFLRGVGIIYLSDGCGWIYAGLRCVIVGLGWWCFLVVVVILGCVYVF